MLPISDELGIRYSDQALHLPFSATQKHGHDYPWRAAQRDGARGLDSDHPNKASFTGPHTWRFPSSSYTTVCILNASKLRPQVLRTIGSQLFPVSEVILRYVRLLLQLAGTSPSWLIVVMSTRQILVQRADGGVTGAGPICCGSTKGGMVPEALNRTDIVVV